MYKTEQEKFWNGKFGADYVDRNREGLSSNINFFPRYYQGQTGERLFLNLELILV